MTDKPIPWTASDSRVDALWNEGDTPASEAVPDMLATIFAGQKRFMLDAWPKEVASGISVPTSPLEWGEAEQNRRVQARIHECFGFLVRELSEAMQHLDGSKSWKDNPRPTDLAEFNEEIADSLHFFIEMCILSGIDAEDLFRLYFAKSAVNHNRVAEGY